MEAEEVEYGGKRMKEGVRRGKGIGEENKFKESSKEDTGKGGEV